MLKKIKNSSSAFTIIESLISLVLLAIIVLGGMRFYLNAQELVILASHKKLATHIANARLEQIRQDPYSSLPDPAPGPAGVNVETNQLIKVGGLDAYRTVKVIDVPGTNSKNVIVTVLWTEAGATGSLSVQFSTYISK